MIDILLLHRLSLHVSDGLRFFLGPKYGKLGILSKEPDAVRDTKCRSYVYRSNLT